MKAIIEYKSFPPKKRLRDDGQDAKGWRFETLEHDEMTFPHLIRATDAGGRSCYYIAAGPDGYAIDIKKVEIKTS
jgi:hypothetical protein